MTCQLTPTPENKVFLLSEISSSLGTQYYRDYRAPNVSRRDRNQLPPGNLEPGHEVIHLQN